MTPTQFRRVRELFEQAIDIAPSELTAWLNVHAGDASEVRRELEALFRAQSARSILALTLPPVCRRCGGPSVSAR
jgi:hypothetical protein